MRLICFFLISILCATMAACDNLGGGVQQGQIGKIGVVDLNRLMKDSEPGKEGLKFIETQQADLQARLDAVQDRLEKNPGDDKAMAELQKLFAASQQQIQTEGQNVVGALFDAIQVCLDDFRKQNGYAMLIRLEALDSYDPAMDVTDKVMAEVNKVKIDFKRIPAPMPEESQEAASPAEKQDSGAATPAAPRPAPAPKSK